MKLNRLPARRQNDDREAGLTLIEMVVALAVAALVVMFLAEGTNLIRHFSLVERKGSAQDEILAVRDHLRRQIGSAMRTQGTGQKSAFAGVGDTVVFSAPGDRLLEFGGPVRVTLTVASEDGHSTLVESRAAAHAGTKEHSARLLAGAQKIGFSYYGRTGATGPAAWTSEWTDPEARPSLMRVDVAFPVGDARRWPPFIVFMPTGADEPAEATAASPPAAVAKTP